MLDQNGAERQGNRLQSKSGPKRSCNRSGTVPECKRPKKTGSYQSSPIFSLFGNLPEPVRVRLPSWDAKKPDRTGLSNTTGHGKDCGPPRSQAVLSTCGTPFYTSYLEINQKIRQIGQELSEISPKPSSTA